MSSTAPGLGRTRRRGAAFRVSSLLGPLLQGEMETSAESRARGATPKINSNLGWLGGHTSPQVGHSQSAQSSVSVPRVAPPVRTIA